MGFDETVTRAPRVVEATVIEELPSLLYRLELGNKAQVLAHGAGSAPALESAQAERRSSCAAQEQSAQAERWPSCAAQEQSAQAERRPLCAVQKQSAKIKNWVRLLPGDRVEVEFAEHDPTRGRIVKKLG